MSPDTQWRQGLQLSATGYIVASLTVAAAILRILWLNAKSLWLDEAISANLAAGTLWSHIGQFARTEAHMLLYFLMLHWWSRVAGSSELSLRLPSAIFAVATVPLIYALGAELCDRRVGLMAALLLSVNVTCIQYAQEARGYAMVMMLVELSSLFFIKSIKQSSLAGARGYVAAGTLATYAHLFGILILPAQWISLFLFPIDRKTILRMTARIALAALLSLPPIILAIHGDRGQVSWIQATTAHLVISTFAMFAGVYWGYLAGPPSSVLFVTYLMMIAIAVAGASERERPAVGFLLLGVLLPVGIALMVSVIKPLFIDRYLLICLPFFVLLGAIGIMRIRSRALIAPIVVVIVVLSISQDRNFYDGGSIEDWRGEVNFVAANAKPGDVLLVYPEWEMNPVHYYVGHLRSSAGFRVVTDRFYTLDGEVAASNDRDATLRRFLAGQGVTSYHRLWIATDMGHSNAPTIRELEAGHHVTAGPDFKGVFLVRID